MMGRRDTILSMEERGHEQEQQLIENRRQARDYHKSMTGLGWELKTSPPPDNSKCQTRQSGGTKDVPNNHNRDRPKCLR
jgi:hypothetical protein